MILAYTQHHFVEQPLCQMRESTGGRTYMHHENAEERELQDGPDDLLMQIPMRV